MKIRIKNDLYDIADRLREINAAYEVYFETELQKFTLWGKGTRQLIFPFDHLDARAVEYARKTSVAYLDDIVNEIDDKNERYQRDRVGKVQDRIEDDFSRRLRLSKL